MDQELPLEVGEFSIAMDASSLAALWPQLPPDLHSTYQDQESMEEVKRRLAAAMAELEVAREEAHRKEQSIAALVDLVHRTAEERDQLRQHLLLARDLVAATTSSSSDSGHSLPPFSPPAVHHPTLAALLEDRSTAMANNDRSTPVAIVDDDDDRTSAVLEQLAAKRPLPQRGRLLQAVMEAGPLLESLLVAGPVPQWRNPPPVQPVPSPVISAPSGSRAPMGWGPW
uniref:Uncharacterized protein n=2 Tax=Hordeum vulgare subsp. vulgare TaxID=112509 RepID=A0A8I7B6L2_HORVV